MADELWIGSTQVSPNQAGLYGTRNMVVEGTDFGTPPEELFLQDSPSGDGQVYLGSWSGGRPVQLTISTNMGATGTLAKGQSEAAALTALIRPGPVVLKVVRDNPAGGSYSRVLRVVPVGRPGWTYSSSPGKPGVSPRGHVLWVAELKAPYPWWRNASASTTSDTTTGTTPKAIAITRSGDLPCGCKISISTSGTLNQVTVTDGVNTMVINAGFSGTAKYVDWKHTIPGEVSVSSGVTFSGRPNIELHSATTTLTFTPGAGSTGTHTFQIDHYPTWETA